MQLEGKMEIGDPKTVINFNMTKLDNPIAWDGENQNNHKMRRPI